MQKYFLHIEYDADRCEDVDGASFADGQAAMTEARLAMKELVAAAILHEDLPPKRIVVEDCRGHRIGEILARELVPLDWL